tara:strand:- start:406 stop:825 length:420 start_codon:yes stop_codon:yes gene_type:complete
MARRIFGNYAVGLHNVGSYMVSCIPFITGSAVLAANSEHQIKFPKVTRSVTVISHTAAADGVLRVHFNSKDVDSVISGLHYVELDSDEDSITMNVKCKEIFISTPNAGNNRTYRVVAELTQIPTGSMFALTGSGLTDLR